MPSFPGDDQFNETAPTKLPGAAPSEVMAAGGVESGLVEVDVSEVY